MDHWLLAERLPVVPVVLVVGVVHDSAVHKMELTWKTADRKQQDLNWMKWAVADCTTDQSLMKEQRHWKPHVVVAAAEELDEGVAAGHTVLRLSHSSGHKLASPDSRIAAAADCNRTEGLEEWKRLVGSDRNRYSPDDRPEDLTAAAAGAGDRDAADHREHYCSRSYGHQVCVAADEGHWRTRSYWMHCFVHSESKDQTDCRHEDGADAADEDDEGTDAVVDEVVGRVMQIPVQKNCQQPAFHQNRDTSDQALDREPESRAEWIAAVVVVGAVVVVAAAAVVAVGDGVVARTAGTGVASRSGVAFRLKKDPEPKDCH